jgi:hypothetical protein
MPLLHEKIHRVYQYDDRLRRRYPLNRRRSSSLARSFTPLQLLVLLAIGAGIAHLVPSLLCILIQFGTVFAMGLLAWWIWQLFRR